MFDRILMIKLLVAMSRPKLRHARSSQLQTFIKFMCQYGSVKYFCPMVEATAQSKKA